MKPSELFEALHALISERVPVHIWGACGVGKSQIGAQVAADRKCEYCTSGPCSLIPSTCAGSRTSPQIARNGFRRSSSLSVGKALGNWKGINPADCEFHSSTNRSSACVIGKNYWMPRNESISTVDSAQCAR